MFNKLKDIVEPEMGRNFRREDTGLNALQTT